MIVSLKAAVVQVDWPIKALSIHIQNPFRITKGNNSLLAPSPFFFCYKHFFCKYECVCTV